MAAQSQPAQSAITLKTSLSLCHSWHLLVHVSAAHGGVEARGPSPVSPSGKTVSWDQTVGPGGSAGPRCCPCWRNIPSLPSLLGSRGFIAIYNHPSNLQQGLIYYPTLWRSSSQTFGETPCGWHTLCGGERRQALLSPQGCHLHHPKTAWSGCE